MQLDDDVQLALGAFVRRLCGGESLVEGEGEGEEVGHGAAATAEEEKVAWDEMWPLDDGAPAVAVAGVKRYVP